MGRILIVEDDVDLSEQVSLWLEGESHEVDVANDGLTACTRLKESDYDLLVLDWDLPGKKGVDICREYRDDGGMAAVLMLTGRGQSSDKEEGLDAGADDYLTKPFDLVELAARARALIRRVERSGKLAKKKQPPRVVEMMVCPQCGSSFNSEIETCNECFIALKLRVLDENIGTTIGARYEILSVIARGGAGAVYLGRHNLMKRTVAIKLLHQNVMDNEKLYKRFQREAEATARLEHPGIAAIHDFGIADDSRPFLVMSYIYGYSLHEILLAETFLEWPRAVRLFIQVADALTHAHQQGVVHRDLKPANIMVEKYDTADECIKLVDFGIAKLKPADDEAVEKLTQDGDIFGTVFYMSPEQCRGEEPDNRADIYSLGCIMYEVVTGVSPIRGTNVLEIIQEHLSTVPPLCGALRPDLNLPAELDAVIEKAMAKDKTQRYQSTAEVSAALRALAR
jgi:DNA-binding response OmpR family regulator/tRNA A-37 threonylcarbamoyl transferase component Bud32